MTDAPEPALPPSVQAADPAIAATPAAIPADPKPDGDAPLASRRHGGHFVFERLGKSYVHGGKALPILWDIDLTLQPGEMVAVVGASGVGKSTFLQILGTLDLPTSGSIRFDGEELTTMSASRLAEFRNRRIGFVFQFHHLLPDFTALENVMMPALIQRVPTEWARRKARDILGRVGLSHRLTHRPGELSGGEQQRVALARAMVLEPSLLLADEPTGNLDRTTGEAIHQLFLDLNRERGSTLLVVTHNPDLAVLMPRRLRMVDGGRLVEERGDSPYRASGGPATEPAASDPVPSPDAGAVP
ncbi:MAG TPA: ABC transporter ATP-binding protein [Kofleriaceae bacterium]|nr:ABC transporter ATP-binding protein [Kofleriaceae bacterium]